MVQDARQCSGVFPSGKRLSNPRCGRAISHGFGWRPATSLAEGIGATLSELALGLIAYGCDTALCIKRTELTALIEGVPVLCEFERFATVEEALAYLLRLPLRPAA